MSEIADIRSDLENRIIGIYANYLIASNRVTYLASPVRDTSVDKLFLLLLYITFSDMIKKMLFI